MCIFTNILHVKKKNTIRQVGCTKLKRKSIKTGTAMWGMKTKQKVNSK